MKQENLELTDLIPIETLQAIQDSFSQLTGMAAITSDSTGHPVTTPSNFTDFCKYSRATAEGRKRCERCDRYGSEETLLEGNANTYYCHAGLMEFSAPIIADGQLVGCFTGGQVLEKEFPLELIHKTAEELNIPVDQMEEAAEKIKIKEMSEITSASGFLFTVASVLSDMAYGKHMALKARDEIEKANKMKSDFLANMSHEIRTPMNGVIGMAELALREELSPQARNYIEQIKSSGHALLAIINDILDFSKIESGKMDILEEEYETTSVFNDVANIIMTRLQNKTVELVLDINPNLPAKLKGDHLRLTQILINLLNNATKFTSVGQVKLAVDFETDPQNNENIELKVCIEDTGIGIKKDDLQKLFNSFQQVDSKRNRTIEGTGLGLAICRNLLNLMNGKIWVESEYGIGSKFYFTLPQKIISPEPCIKINNPKENCVAAIFDNPYLSQQFKTDMERVNVPYCILKDSDGIENKINTLVTKAGNRSFYLFIEQTIFSEKYQNILNEMPNVQAVLITNFYDKPKNPIQNLEVIKKPVSIISYASVLNHDVSVIPKKETEEQEFGFIAPDASILVVDDNSINLTVTEGLLEPLQMHIDTAISARVAFDRVSKKKYDIIFMDHMMPEIDGIEATRQIRKNTPGYESIPIIALTANAMGNVKEMFLKEGMNDFVAKPIELRTIISKVKQWLPPEKIIKDNSYSSSSDSEENIEVADLDTRTAIKMLGSKNLFWTILKEYYKSIPKKIDKIREYEAQEDWKSYTIEVHALKSSSKQIGAMELSNMAADLEQAGNAEDGKTIHANTEALLEKYDTYIETLMPYCESPEDEESEDNKKTADPQKIAENLDFIIEAADNLDQDTMESCLKELKEFQLDKEQSQILKDLCEAIENIDVDTVADLSNKWKSLLSLE